MNFIGLIVVRTHLLVGLYGFTRGYRSIPYDGTTTKVLFTTKIANGLTNGFMYCMPIWNIPMVMSCLNRLEIKARRLESNKYLSSYQEWVGMCYDTL